MPKRDYRQPIVLFPLFIVVGCLIRIAATIFRPLSGHRARALIRCGDEILLVKNFTNPIRWTLPGGGYEHSESTAECAARELYEELHLSINPREFHSPTTHTERLEHRTWHYDCMVANLTTIPALKLNPEILQAAWFSVDNLPRHHSPYIDTML